MSNPSSNVDYESIVCKFGAKDSEIEKLGKKKQESVQRLQTVFEAFQRAQAECDFAQKKNQELMFTLKQEKMVLKSLEEEKAVWDQQLEKKQREIEELKNVIKMDSVSFKENCKLLRITYEKMFEGLNNEALSKEIQKITANIEALKTATEESELELQRLKEQPDMDEFARIPGLKELTEALEKESVEVYGKPEELKKKLKQLQQTIDYLKSRIFEMEN